MNFDNTANIDDTADISDRFHPQSRDREIDVDEEDVDRDGESSLCELRMSSLSLLDFDEVRQRLADRAYFHEARQLALEIAPSFDPYEVARLQRETADARALLDEIDDIFLQSDTDTSELVARAVIGGILTGAELLAVADSLEVHRRARTAARAAHVAPLMAEIAELIPDLRELQRQIRSKIDGRGDVVDDATPTLRALRSQVRQAHSDVTAELQRFIQSSTVRDSLQDPIIAVRGDRLVVPVKVERRHRVSGIVHDASNTGATVFIEPFSTVEMGNRWRELALEEEREVARVLRDMSALVGATGEDIRLADRMTAQLDFALARARYGRSLDAVTPAIIQWRSGDASPDDASSVSDDAEQPSAELEPRLRLIRARHPLLERDAVPLSVDIGPDWCSLVVTGPNTGGKTVAMKTIGLAALMHQSGIQIPSADGSALPIFDGVFADIGDKQSIKESISSFGSHMRSVIRILRHAGPRSLVLLDELGASTDPEEGSALAKAIIGHLASQSVATVVTTHHRNVAAFAETNTAIMNASFELNPETLEPTYRMTVGVPGRSYAMAVAERLGIPPSILAQARDLIEPQHMLFEDWMNELQHERSQLQTNLESASLARAEVEALRREAETLREQARAQLDYIIDRREDIVETARAVIAQRFAEAGRKLEGIEASLRWAAPVSTITARHTGDEPTPVERAERIRRELSAVDLPDPVPVVRRKLAARPLGVGDAVFVRGMNLHGSIADLNARNEEAVVAIGNVRISVDMHRLSRVEADDDDRGSVRVAAERPTPFGANLGPALTDPEIDLRGMRADEAQVNLDEFLDHALRDGLTRLRVIHGRGTGVLRNVVREHLRHHRSVRGYGPEPRERGGTGATWVDLED